MAAHDARSEAAWGAALVDVRLDVMPLQPCSSSPTVAGCQLGGYPAGRDWWGGERVVGGVVPRFFHIVADVWGESSIMTDVYQRWCCSNKTHTLVLVYFAHRMGSV